MGLALQLQERWDLANEQFQIAINQKSDHAPPILIWAAHLQLRNVLMRPAMRWGAA